MFKKKKKRQPSTEKKEATVEPSKEADLRGTGYFRISETHRGEEESRGWG